MGRSDGIARPTTRQGEGVEVDSYNLSMASSVTAHAVALTVAESILVKCYLNHLMRIYA